MSSAAERKEQYKQVRVRGRSTFGGKFEFGSIFGGNYESFKNRLGPRAREEGRRSDAGLRLEPARQAALARLGGGVDRVGGQVALGRDAGMRSEAQVFSYLYLNMH